MKVSGEQLKGSNIIQDILSYNNIVVDLNVSNHSSGLMIEVFNFNLSTDGSRSRLVLDLDRYRKKVGSFDITFEEEDFNDSDEQVRRYIGIEKEVRQQLGDSEHLKISLFDGLQTISLDGDTIGKFGIHFVFLIMGDEEIPLISIPLI